MKTTLAIRLAPWLATAALFIVWEAACRIFNIPVFFLPPPSLVFKAVIDYSKADGGYAKPFLGIGSPIAMSPK